MPKSVEDVREFWENNPLFTGESRFQTGSREYFDEHAGVVVEDGFAGEIDERIFPARGAVGEVLDLGCGPGFWTAELAKRGFTVTAADLTKAALELTRVRCEALGFSAKLSLQNAEQMSFPDAMFVHVNCQGVIHHTPDTEACVREIARVLIPGGTASISVYYKNIFLRGWPLFSWAGRMIGMLGGTLKGRGREGIYQLRDVDEIVRLYDGRGNPIGKCFTRKQFISMLDPYFTVLETYLHFFPARTLPLRLPKWLHRLLDRRAGFLIYAKVVKRYPCAEFAEFSTQRMTRSRAGQS
jgi:SAM-dependent methyltransferase